MQSIKVNIGVCGRFHFHNYVSYLAEKGVLNRFYFSQKIGAPKNLGKAASVSKNLWIKEYLMRGIGPFLQDHYAEQFLSFCHEIWQNLVLQNWDSAPIFHLLLHGTGLRIIKKTKSENGIVLVEIVNAHPLELAKLLEEEDEKRLSLPKKNHLWAAEKKRIEEIYESDFLLVPSNWVLSSLIKYGIDKKKIFKFLME
ncbi:hypothetical protein [Methylacidiphilum kamchatkense]|uniref:Uncharacterized protein n=1 Tax=Methylacidiphilum kamchatkense Kam1 TaxID=1202785 RepID=A0A516TNS4_9BACT|nr:hypothetical protein [Methylacidiphilum kamchatkense]QDQ42889.1 hypothetical protein kam1_1674 [Methylacidiphilum kamchatkense Kam1]